MKKLTLIFTLLFSTVMFSSPSYAEWTKLYVNDIGNTYYLDFERIKKHGGSVYYWILSDLSKPINNGSLSGKLYAEGDCKLFRLKDLSYSFHSQPMGRGTGVTNTSKNPKWYYPSPNSVNETILKSVCSR